KRTVPQVIFVGQHLSASYMNDLFDIIEGKDISINVISKSGTTTEPAIAFRIFKQYMEKKYGTEAKERIYVTTDAEKGALKQLAEKEGYESFVIPDDVGGRYSVLTAVGLLPIAASGISIDEMMNGAKSAMQEYDNEELESNASYQYAVMQNFIFSKNGGNSFSVKVKVRTARASSRLQLILQRIYTHLVSTSKRESVIYSKLFYK